MPTLIALKNLTWLDVSHTQITDAGLKEIGKLRNLTQINVNGTRVTAAGLSELKKSLPNANID